jgi:hypothetical protein
MRFLTVYSYAYRTPSAIWSQIQSIKLDGIRCDGACLRLTYWGSLVPTVSHANMSHFTFHLNFLSVCDEDMEDFTTVMLILSRTVRVASFNLEATNQNCQIAFQIIQKTFSNLIALELTNLSRRNSAWALRRNWACTPVLQTLRLRSCRLSFSLLTDFFDYLDAVINIIMDNCVPEDASEGVAFIGLGRNRIFKHLNIPDQYRDGFTTGSIVIFRYSEE